MGRGYARMDSNKAIDPIWFFHIPKTSGRFFYANTVRVLEQELIINGKQYGDVLHGYGHLSFKPLDNKNILSFSTLREPVARTISHYQHIYFNSFDSKTVDIESEKRKMLDFLIENPNKGIIDYQTKFIAYSGDSYAIHIDEHELKNKVSDEDFLLAKQRIKSVDYLFKTEEMSHDITKKSLAIMRNHFGIKDSDPYFETTIHNIINPNSKLIYNSLTKKEKSIIEDLMPNDMDLYYSAEWTV
jgi:hypothetical protein